MAKHPPGKEQVERYFASVEALAESVDSLLYWNSQADKYPLSSTIAMDILLIRAQLKNLVRVLNKCMWPP